MIFHLSISFSPALNMNISSFSPPSVDGVDGVDGDDGVDGVDGVDGLDSPVN